MYWDYQEQVHEDETREEKIMRLCRMIYTGRYKVSGELVAAAVLKHAGTQVWPGRPSPGRKPPLSH